MICRAAIVLLVLLGAGCETANLDSPLTEPRAVIWNPSSAECIVCCRALYGANEVPRAEPRCPSGWRCDPPNPPTTESACYSYAGTP